MGRIAIAHRTKNVHPSGLDRLDAGATDHEQAASGDSSLEIAGTGTSLSGVAASPKQVPPLEEELAEKEVVLRDIWFQLSPRERQCFGHRFSDMVLKAFGLRPVPEVKS
jgi:hypothetical protein